MTIEEDVVWGYMELDAEITGGQRKWIRKVGVNRRSVGL